MGFALSTGLFAGFLAWGANPALGEAASMNGFDLEDATIPRSEIHYGGLPRDAIPAIDSPYFESVDQAEAFLLADDLVLSLEWRGEVRAYPTRILDYHEIVNDVIDGDALVITFCPLCGTGMVFKRKIGGEASREREPRL